MCALQAQTTSHEQSPDTAFICLLEQAILVHPIHF